MINEAEIQIYGSVNPKFLTGRHPISITDTVHIEGSVSVGKREFLYHFFLI